MCSSTGHETGGSGITPAPTSGSGSGSGGNPITSGPVDTGSGGKFLTYSGTYTVSRMLVRLQLFK